MALAQHPDCLDDLDRPAPTRLTRDIPSNINGATFDAIIIGAGINGAGIARDASMRGLKVLLLDKGDIGSGTTSWSTRLIHGGLRYLEHGEIWLVRESLVERERLFRIAPHLVRPLAFVIPVHETSARGLWTLRAGMAAYDLLSYDKSLARHRILSRAATLESVPGVRADALKGAALYYDAQVEFPERLAIENALAAMNSGARILTRARVDGLIFIDGKVAGVRFTDMLTGRGHEARASMVINVAGPWVDEVLTGIVRRPQRLIGGTKGSHIVVETFPGAPRVGLYVEAQADRRPFFILPWNGKYLIGTTDTNFAGNLDRVAADVVEIAYLLREANHIIPSAKLTRESILYTYSGVRPLPFRAWSSSSSAITRRHFVHDHAPAIQGLLSIIGGKLTTYRNLAEQAVDAVFAKLHKRSPPCTTAREPLPGATREDFAALGELFRRTTPLAAAVIDRLLRIYGTRSRELLELAVEDPKLLEPIATGSTIIAAEVVFSFKAEMAVTLEDVLMRRTMGGLDADMGWSIVEAVARVAQNHLGWSEQHVESEVNAYRRSLGRFHPAG